MKKGESLIEFLGDEPVSRLRTPSMIPFVRLRSDRTVLQRLQTFCLPGHVRDVTKFTGSDLNL